MEYAYRLAPYKGKRSRLTCPSCGRTFCFSPYVDETGNILDPAVGRCDHESSCAYHKTPKEYFREHPDCHSERSEESWRKASEWLRHSRHERQSQPQQLRPCHPERSEESPCTLPPDIVRKTIRLQPESGLITFLKTLFPDDIIQRLVQTYWLGVTQDLGTVFYQIDKEGRIRAGKIIRYNPQTGHRIKDDTSKIPVDWVHTRLKRSGILPDSWQLSQCLFGEHLLPQRPDAIVCLVEAEKTAVICAGFFPDFLWLATGGKGQLGDRLDSLYGRRVVAYPDVDAFADWSTKLKERPWLSILVSDYLETTATPEERATGIDIADRLISYYCHPEAACHPERSEGSIVMSDPFGHLPIHPIHPIQAIRQNPEVAALIEDLGLEIKSITYIKPQQNENPD